MEDKEAAFKASCRAAIDSLEEKRKPWHKRQKNVHSAFDLAKQEPERFLKDLQAGVDQAKQVWKGFVADVRGDGESTQSNANAATWAAEREVSDAQRDSDEVINSAQGDLQRAWRDFENGFGSAKRNRLRGSRRLDQHG